MPYLPHSPETGSAYRELRLGESVTATLLLKNDARDKTQAGARLRIPAAALAYWKGQSGVFLDTGKGVRFEPLTVEASDDATAVVRAALPPNARIAVSGIAALKGLLSGGQ